MHLQVLSIKLLVNWLLGLSCIGTAAEMEKSASSVVRLLGTILEHNGDLNAQDNISYVTLAPRYWHVVCECLLLRPLSGHMIAPG